MNSLVILVPISHLNKSNAMLGDLGWPDDNFTVALSETGAAPATHRGLRATVDGAFSAALDQSLAQNPALSALLTVDICDDKDRHHQFASAIAAEGLLPILPQFD